MAKKLILGIETSCDDTSIALIRGEPYAPETSSLSDKSPLPEVLILNSFSQEMLLEKWGGVVPEIAARNHMEKIVPLLKASLTKAQVQLEDIDIIAVTSILIMVTAITPY